LNTTSSAELIVISPPSPCPKTLVSITVAFVSSRVLVSILILPPLPIALLWLLPSFLMMEDNPTVLRIPVPVSLSLVSDSISKGACLGCPTNLTDSVVLIVISPAWASGELISSAIPAYNSLC
jgi:hypothetical protein